MDFNTTCKDKKAVDQSILLCCKLFISEARNSATLDAIEQAAKMSPETVIVNKFEDRTYNRTRYTLVSYVLQDCTGSAMYSPLHRTVIAMAEAAFNAINLESHEGAHPRLGVVDDIVFHPLARASLDEAAWFAKAVAADIGNRFNVPTFLYGVAHEERRSLDSIRRVLGYFRPNSSGNQWIGGPESNFLTLKPGSGPSQATPSKGVVVIGATDWVDYYNVPLLSSDIDVVRRIAKRVSGRGGGLPSVQAMALAHGEGVPEVACNLLDPSRIGGESVQEEVEGLAREEGISLGKGYFTDFSQEEIIQSYLKLGPFD